MRRSRLRADALDRLEYEDRALRELVEAFGDESLDRRQHGEVVSLLVEHLAIREAARQHAADGLDQVDEVQELADGLRAGTVDRPIDLVIPEELGGGVQAANRDQGQDIDAVVARILPGLRRNIDADLGQIIPEVRRRLPIERRAELLPSARYVVRHVPTPPGVRARPVYERIGPRLRALYDLVRGFPSGWAKPRVEVEAPSTGDRVP
jgi:hypothetical protein